MVRLRSLLPVSSLVLEPRPDPHLSRPVKQRVLRRRHIDAEINDCFDAINWYGGCCAAGTGVSSEVSTGFGGLVRDLVSERLGEERDVKESEHEAVKALLKGRASVYEDAVDPLGGMATFNDGRISLPEDTSDCPMLTSMLSGRALESVEGFSSTILNSAEEQAAVDASVAKPCLYMDLVLSAHPELYHKFIRGMSSREMIRYACTPPTPLHVVFRAKEVW